MKSRHTLEMPYIGSVLSINHCYYRNSRKYKKAVVAWMGDLSEKASWIPPTLRSTKARIRLSGIFKNRNALPDLHNLHKIISDAVAAGLGVPSDVDFMFTDEGYTLRKTAVPTLHIVVEFEE